MRVVQLSMQLRCLGSEIATTLNEFNQSLERQNNLICRRLFTASKKKEI